MTFWIIILRAVGSLLFLVGVVGGVINILSLQAFDNFWWAIYHVWLPVIEDLAFSLLCFGAAAGLRRIRKIDQRIERATVARRRIVAQQTQSRNLAPDAPPPASTARYVDEGEKIRHSGGRTLRRIDQAYIDRRYTYRVGAPTIGEAPPAVRTTPGAEDQYKADTQNLVAFRPQDNPKPKRPPPGTFQRGLDPVVDRDVLKRGRDNAIRRAQAEQARKRNPRP